MFERIQEPLDLKMATMRTFASGKVYLCYEPMT